MEDDKNKWLRFYYNPFTPAKEQGHHTVNSENLKYFKACSNNTVQIPEYNRDISSVNRWILHIGVGQFHRAHQLVYMDELLLQDYLKQKESSNKTSERWGYCGVGLTCYDEKMKLALQPQNFLFTVLERSNKRIAARIIGSMFDYFLGYEEPEKALKYLISADLRIVSLTITEKGYCQDVSGNLAEDNPFIQHDLLLLKSVSSFC
jgi:mannitol 2-dehydrogenase